MSQPRSTVSKRARLIVMAGLPGTGKSTLARAISEALDGLILDKDQVRSCLFPPDLIAYSRVQDDLCVDVMLQVAAYLFEHTDPRSVLLDGRTYSRRDQMETVVRAAQRIGVRLYVIECRCSDETAVQRITQDRDQEDHPAANRDAALYWRVKARREPLEVPHLTVNTGAPLDACLEAALQYLDNDQC